MKRYSAKEIFEIARALHRANFDTLTRAGVPEDVLWMVAIGITTVESKLSKGIKQELRKLAADNKDPVTAARIRESLSEQGRRQPKRDPSDSIDMLLLAIRMRNPAFNKWEALAGVLGDMLALRGWSDRHITEGMLRKRWKREKEKTDGSSDSGVSSPGLEAIAARAPRAARTAQRFENRPGPVNA